MRKGFVEMDDIDKHDERVKNHSKVKAIEN